MLLASGFLKVQGFTKLDEGFQPSRTLITLPLGAFGVAPTYNTGLRELLNEWDKITFATLKSLYIKHA